MDIHESPKGCIRTNSGLFINVFEPTKDVISIEDIAHALASIPRFGGHLNRHYSVAQHSVMCMMKLTSYIRQQGMVNTFRTKARSLFC